jgi:endoglucanase
VIAAVMVGAGLLTAGAIAIAIATISPIPTSSPTMTPTATPGPDPGYGLPLDVPPDSLAARAAADPASSVEDRELIRRIAEQPTATWVTGPTRLVEERVRQIVDGAASRDAIAVIVAYNIPGRDCGGHSASGEALGSDDYRAWLDGFVQGLGGHRAVIVLEPDAVAQLYCEGEEAGAERARLLREAVERLSAQGSYVYLDAGHAAWLSAESMAERLELAGVDRATGFSLNVSNFGGTEEQIAYGRRIAALLPGDPRIVVDTGRNGRPSDSGDWCNPPDRALGAAPTTETGDEFVDAYLWIKPPGNSDGECNGGPPAGQWWGWYAVMLARNAAATVTVP